MNILKTILENKELADKINYKCDIIIYPEMRKQEDADGHITWNIDGMAFGADASGGEFVLLSDGTIGFNSSEGETGRIAENMTELFELLIKIVRVSWIFWLMTFIKMIFCLESMLKLLNLNIKMILIPLAYMIGIL